MFIGINTNVKHAGMVFHVQTEDGGLDHHTLTTILFKDGAIFSSKKTNYSDIPKSPSYNDTVQEIMREQHKDMMRDLIRGKFDAEFGDVLSPESDDAQAASKPEGQDLDKSPQPLSKKGLEQLILEYLDEKAP